jgi:hypothetical protein
VVEEGDGDGEVTTDQWFLVAAAAGPVWWIVQGSRCAVAGVSAAGPEGGGREMRVVVLVVIVGCDGGGDAFCKVCWYYVCMAVTVLYLKYRFSHSRYLTTTTLKILRSFDEQYNCKEKLL